MKLTTRLGYVRAAITGRIGQRPPSVRYAGAGYSQTVARWFAELADPNEELRYTLADLRARSRQLVRDNGEAEGLLKDFESDIVGAQGARLQFRATMARGKPLDTINDRVEAAWLAWGHRDTCTVSGYEDFASLQRLMIRTVIQDGEFLALRVRDPDLPFGYALQQVDADQLDETYNRAATDALNAIVMGVEVNRRGKPVAYHIWDRHPSQVGRVREIVPASDVRHVFKRLRAGQVRGVPWFAPALVQWKLGDRYTEAELYQSLLAAAQGGFFENEEGTALDMPRDEHGNAVPLTMEAVPGQATALPGGWTFKAWQPTHPTANYVGFMKAVKRGIARAFGRSYASLTGDLSDVNFSSMRTDRIREIEQNKVHQQELLIGQFCEPVFADWARMALLVGALGTMTMDVSALSRFATFMGKGWPWIDPVKDATAAMMDLDMGATSPQRICAAKGVDFYEMVDEIADAKAYAELKGVSLNVVPLSVAATTDAGDDDPADTAPPSRGVLPLRREAA